MSFELALLITVILMGIVGVVTYKLSKRYSNRIIKYIPAITALVGIAFFFTKLNFIPYKTHAFEAIIDIVAIIFLGIMFSIAFLAAIIIEIIQMRKKHLQK